MHSIISRPDLGRRRGGHHRRVADGMGIPTSVEQTEHWVLEDNEVNKEDRAACCQALQFVLRKMHQNSTDDTSTVPETGTFGAVLAGGLLIPVCRSISR